MHDDQTAQFEPLRISIAAAGEKDSEGDMYYLVGSLQIYAMVSRSG